MQNQAEFMIEELEARFELASFALSAEGQGDGSCSGSTCLNLK